MQAETLQLTEHWEPHVMPHDILSNSSLHNLIRPTTPLRTTTSLTITARAGGVPNRV